MKNHKYFIVLFTILIGTIQSCRHEPIEPFKPIGPLEPMADTTVNNEVDFTFTTGVFPIIQNNCVGCHSGPNPAVGIPLTTHSEILPFAASGGLYGVINHEPGYVPMPFGGNKLADSDVNTVKLWIEDGIPNN